jgi:AcrR family transcriptional regulator
LRNTARWVIARNAILLAVSRSHRSNVFSGQPIMARAWGECMPPRTETQSKYNTPLRQAQRDLTRSRIKNAAKNLFYEKHYDTTTMDEIAMAAGLRRSTLYLHYRDKAEILADIIADYTPKARAILATLPGPHPKLKAILLWVKRVAKFVAQEQMPLSIILELRRDSENTINTLERLTCELLAGLGTNNPRLYETSLTQADPTLRARGLLLLQQLTYACEIHLADTADARGKAMLELTAEDFHAFLKRDPEL